METRWMSGWRRLAVMGAICLTAALLMTLPASLLPPLPILRAEYWVRDTVLEQARRSEVRTDLVWLALDRASLQLDVVDPAVAEAEPALKLMSQGYPWSREVYALMLDRLFEAGARMVVIDLLFPGEREGDAALAEALEKYKGRVVLASDFVSAGGATGAHMTARLPALSLLPEEGVTDGRVGFASFFSDPDGRVRQWTPVTSLEELNGFPAGPDTVTHLSLGRASGKSGGWTGDTGGDSPRPLRFASPGAWPEVPLYWLFDPAMWRRNCRSGAVFQDKIVLLGPSSPEFHDEHQTPLGLLPGPVLHLNVFHALLHGGFLQSCGRTGSLILIAAAAVLAWAAAALIRRALISLLVILLGVAAYGWLMIAVLNRFDFLLPGLWPPLTLAAGGLGSLGWQALLTGRERARTRRILERMVSRDMARELMDEKEAMRSWLSGVWRSPAVLYVEIQGVDSRADGQDDPAEMITRLHEAQKELTATVHRHRGHLDKSAGHSLTAAWGTVKSGGSEEDTQRALAAALEIRTRMTDLNARWRAAGKPEFTWGLGLNHGPAILAGAGRDRNDGYTVMGGEVNLAARLEGLCARCGADIVVSLSVAEFGGEEYVFRPLDLVKVDGREKPVTTLALVGKAADLSPADEAWLKMWRSALERYYGGYFAAAAQQFDQCRLQRPDDVMCADFLARCGEFMKQPPREGWDGVTPVTA